MPVLEVSQKVSLKGLGDTEWSDMRGSDLKQGSDEGSDEGSDMRG